MKRCPKCGGTEFQEITIDQDEVGNDIRAIVCATPDCEEVVAEQADAFDCLHWNYTRDMLGRKWCDDCGEYLGER